jgi:hypothetical protein
MPVHSAVSFWRVALVKPALRYSRVQPVGVARKKEIQMNRIRGLEFITEGIRWRRAVGEGINETNIQIMGSSKDFEKSENK